MIPPSQITILWSTQGGRAKACARRTSRILRDYHFYFQQQEQQASPSHQSSDKRCSATADENESLLLNCYGTSFDDYGAQGFLKLGGHTDYGKNYAATASPTAAATHGDQDEDEGGYQRKKLIVMFVSTTGDGEHCDCIQDTWKLL